MPLSTKWHERKIFLPFGIQPSALPAVKLPNLPCAAAVLRRCVLSLLLCTSLTAAGKKDLARVAILTFEDETGTGNFGYMPSSLTDAIDKSLQQRFEYVREEPKKSGAQRRLIKEKGILSAREAAQYCNKNDVQILVYGSFSYDKVKKQIVVDTYISLGTEKDYRRLDERRNPTDASIFNLADKVADDIVAEMTEIAKQQQQAKQGQPGKKDEKLELEKKIPVVWAFKPLMVSLAGGYVLPLGDLRTAYAGGGTVSLSATRLVWNGLFVGMNAQFLRLNSKSTASTFRTSLTVLPVILSVGYSWFFLNDRWRFNAEAGAGYYGAKFEAATDASTAYSRSFSNPAARAAASLHWLVLPGLALGFEASYLHLFDKDQQSGKITNLQLVASYAF